MLNDPADWDLKGQPTATVAEVICAAVGRGLPGEIAANYAGVSYVTLRNWLMDARRVQRRSALEADYEPTESEAELLEFLVAMNESLAGWVHRTNEILEQGMVGRRRTTTKSVYEVRKNAETGEEELVELERHVTQVDDPIDVTPILWRLTRIVPASYGPNPRYERESEEGESETIDIGKRVEEIMDRIAGTLVIAPEEPG